VPLRDWLPTAWVHDRGGIVRDFSRFRCGVAVHFLRKSALSGAFSPRRLPVSLVFAEFVRQVRA
jgi:hypothetical protein